MTHCSVIRNGRALTTLVLVSTAMVSLRCGQTCADNGDCDGTPGATHSCRAPTTIMIRSERLSDGVGESASRSVGQLRVGSRLVVQDEQRLIADRR